MEREYGVIIVGEGLTSIFTALEATKSRYNFKILIIDKGKSIEKTIWPSR